MKIALGTFKENGEELITFLEPRVGVKPTLSGDTVEIEDEGMRQGVKPRQVKTYLKRFLYMKGVRKSYKVFVSGKELTVQEIELGEEEEEEKPKEGAQKEPEAQKVEAKKEEKKEESQPEKPKKAAKKPRVKKKAAGEA